MNIMDYCAGAGGKTLALSALLHNTGQVHAWDIDWRRLRAIWPRMKRAGTRNVQVHDGKENEKLAQFEGAMDVVFCDAPCTGTGTWRRRPDANGVSSRPRSKNACPNRTPSWNAPSAM